MYRIEIPNDIKMPFCEQLVELQRQVWHMDETDLLPAWNLFVTPKIGNILFVVYKSKKPIGFAVFTHAFDKESNEPFIYGEMMGILRKHEGHGLATRIMKSVQKIARKRGIGSIRWTYDPLRANNANIYIDKMGATVKNYYEDYYKNLSGMNAGIPVDRFWAILSTKAKCGVHIRPAIVISLGGYTKFNSLFKDTPSSIAIEIPDNIVDIKGRNLKDAIDMRLASRKIFQKLFSRGYTIKGFYREKDRNFYVAVK